MERLTKRNGDNVAYWNGANGKSFSDNQGNIYGEAITKLAEYEDAEEQGLLLRLPFKVGDVAYYLHKVYLVYADKWIYEIDEVEVDSFLLSEKICVNVAYRIGSEVFRKTLTPYKTLFPTREEAEKALAEMG